MGERLRVRQGEAKGDEPHPQLLPDLQGREAILKVHAAKVKLAENVDFNTIACAASGASGAKLANMVNEAALRAVRQGRRLATREDLQESIEVVIAGYQKKNKILSDHERMIVSYHEIGRALVAALQTYSAPVAKITIIPPPFSVTFERKVVRTGRKPTPQRKHHFFCLSFNRCNSIYSTTASLPCSLKESISCTSFSQVQSRVTYTISKGFFSS